MCNNLIVKKIFAETLHFLLISSIGYFNNGFQTYAMKTAKDLSASSVFNTTLDTVNHLNNLDKNHINELSIMQLNNNFINFTTEMPLFREPQKTDVYNKSAELDFKTIWSTISTSSQTSIISTTIKPTEAKVDNKQFFPKLQKTDAPMLNYIFDMFSTANKHHHHDQRYGPHFEDTLKVGNITNITVQAGASIHLNCRISLLQDKTVSWVRRNSMGEDALELLTVGLHTYTSDQRYTMEFQYPNNWRLKISHVKKGDEATYECQISTHPPRVIQIHLHVNAPKVMIVDEYNIPLQEKYYEIDSTLQLSCIVRNVVMTSSVVYWRHGDQILNYDITRGGVSVRTDLMEDGANSSLSIARISKKDSGNYTCSINDSQDYSIVVHILKGESFAELHHGKGTHLCDHYFKILLIVPLILVLSETTNTFR